MPRAALPAGIVRAGMARVALVPGLGWARPRAALAGLLLAQRGRYALWLPVCMGAGTLAYFALRAEPPVWAGAALFVPAAAGAWLARARPVLRGLLAAVAATALGFVSGQVATARAPPVDPLPTHATWVTGTVLSLESLPAGSRVTLADVRLDGAAVALSRRLRLRLRDLDGGMAAGDVIRLRALLRPPSPPAYPGGWDMQRDAYFGGLAAYGFALGYSEVIGRVEPSGLERDIQALRDTIARRIEAVLPPDQAGIAATLLTGNSAAIPADDHQAFRDSGLAHLLAVAGLHIGIVMGLVMGLVRGVLAAWEWAALRWPVRGISAVAALAGGGFYMLLTGLHVPIIRSFAMACLFTLAVLAGRRAISMRGLALAAVVLILTEPAQVPGVSFQMSFSAVLALIAGYEALRPHLHRLYGDGSTARRIAVHLAGLALTSLLAGTASAPFGAWHFGRIQLYFVPSNMIAVPLTAFWAMPAGLIALALMPFHLEALALVPMGWGVAAILWVARTAAAWPDATLPVPPIPDWGMIATSLGMAWLGLWRGRVRLLGIAGIAAGLVSPLSDHPPDLLVSADARLIALRTQSRFYVQEAPGAAAFTRDAWAQYWALPAAAMPRAGRTADGAVECSEARCRLRGASGDPRGGPMGGPRGLPWGGEALLARKTVTTEDCEAAELLVSAEPARGRCPGLPRVDRFTVWREGATAVWLEPSGPRILTDRAARGERPWVPSR